MFDQFKSKWITHRVDYDRVYGYQCVDLIKEYVHEVFQLSPGSWGDAIDYWTHTNPTLLTKFTKVAGSDVRKGDIVIKKPNHIGIATGGISSTQIEILEQNGGGNTGTGTGTDAIRTRWINRSDVAGLLRPKTAQVVVKVNPGTWNVRSTTSTANRSNILTVVKGGTTFTASIGTDGWAHINAGYIGPAAFKKI